MVVGSLGPRVKTFSFLLSIAVIVFILIFPFSFIPSPRTKNKKRRGLAVSRRSSAHVLGTQTPIRPILAGQLGIGKGGHRKLVDGDLGVCPPTVPKVSSLGLTRSVSMYAWDMHRLEEMM